MGLTRPRLGQFQTTTAAFDDPIVVFNNNASGSNTKDIGIVFERGDDQNKVLLWDESADEFVLANSTEQGSTGGDVTLASYADLHINDLTLSGSIASLTINDAFTFPTADGTAGYVLKTDGAGTVSWASAGSDTSGHIIQSAGTTQTTRGNINFDGTYITVTDDSVNDQHDISVSSNLQTWHGTTAPSGTVVGTTDTQTLTNKTLTSPNITGLQLSGTTVTSTAAELNILDGVTATTTELNYTDGVTSNIQTQLNGKLSTTGGTITSNLTVTGNLTVNGTTTTVSTTNMVVSDNLIELNNGASSNANDSGIVIERGSTGDNAFMGWDESADRFIVGTTTATGSSTGNLTVTASKLTVATPTASSDAATKGYVDTQVSGTVSSLGDLGVTATAAELNKLDGAGTVWHSGNDGSGSGLDADTLDGQHGSYYTGAKGTGQDYVASSTLTTNRGNFGDGVWAYSGYSTGTNRPHTYDATLQVMPHSSRGFEISADWVSQNKTPLKVRSLRDCCQGWSDWTTIWTSGTDGAGSGLDADLLDGYQSSTSATANTIALRDGSGNLTAGVFSGTATSAQYADLAEKYMPDGVYQPGTVLQFGGVEEVTIANEYATHRVAGVVSTDPAYMMNSALEDGVYIALQGRVPCRVVGTCEKGDLMVTSDTDGCAVAWTESFSPPYGSVIGKALENKQDDNESVIEVVVGVR